MKTWREAVIDSIKRIIHKKKSYFFSRQEIISFELEQIEQETSSHGVTPSQTLSRILQELRDDKLVEFIDNQGNYIFLGENVNIEKEVFPKQAIDAAIKSGKLTFGNISTNESVALSRQRIGQNRLRYWTLVNYQNRCALCDISDRKLLVASHIARWADCPKGRGDLQNIVCLCRWHDPLLEYGIISFSDNYDILMKPTHSEFLGNILQKTNPYRYPIEKPLSKEYLAIHRQRTGFN